LNKSKPAPKTRPEDHSTEALARVLRRFRECCKYAHEPPEDEAAVQHIVGIMIRSQFDLVDREDTLPKFGAKNYKPDFGIPGLITLVEVKYLGEKTQVASIQEEIIADVPGYLSDSSPYEHIVVFVYDAAHKLLDPRRFVDDLCSIKGIAEVIPGVA
jgi:DpnII restriction endonuclease